MKSLVVVAHPDDEVIWTGGLILRHPTWEWTIVSLCRAADSDRLPRFYSAARSFGASVFISDLDDSPVLAPLSPDLHEIKDRILGFVSGDFDLILTHGEKGEYTRHERHEQVHKAAYELIKTGHLTGCPMFFAYDDCAGSSKPKPSDQAQLRIELTPQEFQRKRSIVHHIYGFEPGSFEYEAAGPVEAFSTLPGREMTDLEAVIRFSEQ